MARAEKRKEQKQIKNIVTKAKEDMRKYVSGLSYIPTENELKAWQHGYVAGINMVSQKVDNDR